MYYLSLQTIDSMKVETLCMLITITARLAPNKQLWLMGISKICTYLYKYNHLKRQLKEDYI